MNGDSALKITAAKSTDARAENATCGEVTSISRGIITVACGKGSLLVSGVFPENKRRMTATDYVTGGKIKVGSVLK